MNPTPRNLLAIALGCGLTSVTATADPLVVRGTLSLSPRTAVVARGSLAYAGGTNSFAVADITNPDNPRLVGQTAADGASLVAAEAGGDYVYCAGEGHGLLIFNVADPQNPSMVTRFQTGNIKDVAVQDTLVVVAATSFVMLIGVRDRAHPHVLASYGRAASWAEFESDSRRVHFGSPNGAFRLEIRTSVSGGDTNFSFVAGPQYGNDNVSPIALVSTLQAECINVVRTATLQTLLSSDYTLAGQYLAPTAIRAIAAGLHFSVLTTTTGIVIHLDQSQNSPQFLSSADLQSPANSISMGECQEGQAVVVGHVNGLTALTFGTAAADRERAAPLASALSLQAHPNPFNSVVRLSIAVPRPGDFRLVIFDILGREIHSESLFLRASSNERPLTFTGLPSGLYLARLSGESSSTVTRLLYLP